MKRLWYSSLVLVTSLTMVGTAHAQTWNQSSEIGSYQSIMSKAGHSNPAYGAPAPYQETQPSVSDNVTPPSVPAATAPANPPVAPAAQANSGACEGPCGSVYNAAFGDGSGGDVYTPGRRLGLRDRGNGGDANWVVGFQGLFFDRDHEDDLRLTRTATDTLLSTDADNTMMGGLQLNISRRGCAGNGWEFVYWGLYPDQGVAWLDGPGLTTYLTGLSEVFHPASGQCVCDIFNNADQNRIYRDNDINNIEGNLLRYVGRYNTRRGRQSTVELLAGFRWFQFDENFRYTAATAATPELIYDINVDNSLLGAQLGGRSEHCCSDQFRIALGLKGGLYNNFIDHAQRIYDDQGNYSIINSGPNAGTDYNFASDKDDLSFLGELDLGFIYQFTSNARTVIGYRVVGVAGLALAPDQVPNDFTLIQEIESINSNGSLILGGGYAGMEFCF